VKKEEEEALDPHAIQQQLQQANSKLADAWKVVKDASSNFSRQVPNQLMLGKWSKMPLTGPQLWQSKKFLHRVLDTAVSTPDSWV
jgi:hypothetical protein